MKLIAIAAFVVFFVVSICFCFCLHLQAPPLASIAIHPLYSRKLRVHFQATIGPYVDNFLTIAPRKANGHLSFMNYAL